MNTRPDDDFLGWAPAEPLEWAPEQPGDTPGSARHSGDAVPLTRVPLSQAPPRPAGQPPPSEPARTPRTSQPTPARPSAGGTPRQPVTPVRPRQPAGPLFGVTAIAAGMLLLFTIAMVIMELSGESTLGVFPILAGAGSLALLRAAARMRSR